MTNKNAKQFWKVVSKPWDSWQQLLKLKNRDQKTNFQGMYNTSELELHWEEKSPITLAPELHLTEYVMLNMWTNETTINADLSDLRHGAFSKKTIMNSRSF